MLHPGGSREWPSCRNAAFRKELEKRRDLARAAIRQDFRTRLFVAIRAALEDRDSRSQRQNQQYYRRGHENGEARHDEVDRRLHEAVGDPQPDVQPSQIGIQTRSRTEKGKGQRHGVEECWLLH